VEARRVLVEVQERLRPPVEHAPLLLDQALDGTQPREERLQLVEPVLGHVSHVQTIDQTIVWPPLTLTASPVM
jgi:hypothetical protein